MFPVYRAVKQLKRNHNTVLTCNGKIFLFFDHQKCTMHGADKFISSVSFLLVYFAYVTKKFTTKLKYFFKILCRKKILTRTQHVFIGWYYKREKKKTNFRFTYNIQIIMTHQKTFIKRKSRVDNKINFLLLYLSIILQCTNPMSTIKYSFAIRLITYLTIQLFASSSFNFFCFALN